MSDEADIQAQERLGTVLSEKWTLERVLGVGGMATVYAGRHRNGARAAVKVLHAELSRNAEVRERFLREGYAANRVEHPGVVKVLDDDVISTGPDAGTAYLVMELLEGESLQDRLERGPPMGEREYLTIAESVLDVLEVAHARGVVHRDLKPENLFLLREQGETRVKVLDFGLARLLQGQSITSYGLALGTPSFMSPEQAAGRVDEIDGRTDLFALAATGFRLRTGRRIHEGFNAVELVTKMAQVAAPRIRSVAAGVSAPFARVIDRALEFRREDRYASAAAMREDVSKAISEIDASVHATELALAPPPMPSRSGEATIEVSERDLEPPVRMLERSESADRNERVRMLERSESADRDERVRMLERSESADRNVSEAGTSTLARALPRRRSLLPLFAVLVFGAIGGKLWLDAGRPDPFAPATPTRGETSASPSAAPPATAPEPSKDGGQEEASAAGASGITSADASAARPPPAIPAAPASVAHPAASAVSSGRRLQSSPSAQPSRPGPGKVRKLPALHHVASTPTKTAH